MVFKWSQWYTCTRFFQLINFLVNITVKSLKEQVLKNKAKSKCSINKIKFNFCCKSHNFIHIIKPFDKQSQAYNTLQNKQKLVYVACCAVSNTWFN